MHRCVPVRLAAEAAAKAVLQEVPCMFDTKTSVGSVERLFVLMRALDLPDVDQFLFLVILMLFVFHVHYYILVAYQSLSMLINT